MIASYCVDDNEEEYNNYWAKILKQDDKLIEGKLLLIPASGKSYNFLVKSPRTDTDFDVKTAVVGVVGKSLPKSKCANLCNVVWSAFKDKFTARRVLLADGGGLDSASRELFKKAISDVENDRVDKIKSKLNDVKSAMKENLISAVNRGEDLEKIEDDARDLDADAQNFNRTAVKLRRFMCCKNAKWTIMLTLLIMVIIAVIVIIAVCSNGDTCKQDNNNDN